MNTGLTRHIRAPRIAVYRAILDPESVRQWMVPDDMTSEVHHFDAREGGTFRISLTYDDPSSESGKTTNRTDSYHGVFAELIPGRKVVQRLEFESDDPAMQGEMTITYVLNEIDGGTELICLHEHLPPALSPTDNELGWQMSLTKLAELVEHR